jgi:hypothetical protein
MRDPLRFASSSSKKSGGGALLLLLPLPLLPERRLPCSAIRVLLRALVLSSSVLAAAAGNGGGGGGPPPPPSPSSCDVARDDIRLFGSGGDAGRVEMCHESTWRYVCSPPPSPENNGWTLATASVACRQLGYRSAFMADNAGAMAFGETVDSGAAADAGGITVEHCDGDERTLRDCRLGVDDPTCTVRGAVGAACSAAASDTAASTHPAALGESVRSHAADMSSWFASEEGRRLRRHQQRQRSVEQPECGTEQGECVVEGPPLSLQEGSIPTPFHDVRSIKEAFLFPDFVTSTYEQIQNDFNRSLMMHASGSNNTMELLREALPKIRWNVFGMDFSDFFPPPMTLDQVKSVMQQSPVLEAARDLYLSANRHIAIHWFLDSPYRYYSQPADPRLLGDDPSARKMFDALQRNGIVVVDDFGADVGAIVRLAEGALTGDSLYRKNETSVAGGGSIVTSRRPIPQLDDLLVRNGTLAAVIGAYLGPSILHGYKVTRLTEGLTSTDQYNAGMYHHDRVGRRLKLFVFLNDVDCESGHPTKVAAGSQNLLYYKTEDYPVTRFADDYVERNYEIVRGCGRRGGGFLFDTHTIHKGTVQGDRERTVVIAEYHHIAKCAYSKEHKLGIPCPAGDIYRADAPLMTTMT